jgi:8-oxo-dGTP diphosphatase
MNRYVVGFAFTKDREYVLVIKKLRPDWQKGLLNGIGGKIEPGETPIEAMKRECMEEAHVELDWIHKGVMRGINNDGADFECHLFYSYDNNVIHYTQVEDEELSVMKWNDVLTLPHINNLSFLIPYGRCKDGSDFITIEYR